MIKLKRKKSSYVGALVIDIICILFSFICIYPVFWLLMSALKDNTEFILNSVALPTHLNFSNFPEAIKIGHVFTAMGNSAFYAAIEIVLVNAGAFITSYFLSRFDFKGKKLVSTLYLFGMLVPLYALLVPVFVQWRLLGLLNNRLSLVITYFAMQMPIALFLYESFIKGISCEIEDAATIDGCSIWQTLSMVIFPLCKPIMGTVSILTMIQVWNEFAFSVILTSRTDLRTVSVAVRSYSSSERVQYTFMFAGLTVVTLPIIIAYSIFSKQIIQGMTAGAVKG
jgi:raffinose/stachyose/melibiose transport system permease protein